MGPKMAVPRTSASWHSWLSWWRPMTLVNELQAEPLKVNDQTQWLSHFLCSWNLTFVETETGVFLKWGYPNSWMGQKIMENPSMNGWWLTPMSENLHIDVQFSWMVASPNSTFCICILAPRRTWRFWSLGFLGSSAVFAPPCPSSAGFLNGFLLGKRMISLPSIAALNSWSFDIICLLWHDIFMIS